MPTILESNLTAGTVKALAAWEATVVKAAKGTDPAKRALLARTLGQLAIGTACSLPDYPLDWKVVLLALAEVGFEKVTALKDSEAAIVNDLAAKYLFNKDADPLAAEDRQALVSGLLAPRGISVTTVDELEDKLTRDNISHAPDPKAAYERSTERLDGTPESRGGVYSSVFLAARPALKQAYDSTSEVLRARKAVPPDPPKPRPGDPDPAHTDPAHPEPGHTDPAHAGPGGEHFAGRLI